MNTLAKKLIMIMLILLSNSLAAAENAATLSGSPSISTTSIKPYEKSITQLFYEISLAEESIDQGNDAELKRHKETYSTQQFKEKPSSWAHIYQQHTDYLQFLLTKMSAHTSTQ